MINYINLTPHMIALNNGTEHSPSGSVARVSVSFEEIEPGRFRQVFGEIQNLPEPKSQVRYIVSGLVLAASSGRDDLVAPATGHPDVKRNEQGHIISVPGFVVA